MLAREYCHLAEHCVQISAEQGQFFRLLIRFADARRIITVGTCTDYSALCMTQATGSHRHLVCCDISTEWTDTAQEYWARVGVFERIDLRIAPAHSPMDWDWRKELRVHRSVLEEFVLHKDDDAMGKLKPQKVLWMCARRWGLRMWWRLITRRICGWPSTWARSSAVSRWCPQVDSNHQSGIRNPVVYPLNRWGRTQGLCIGTAGWWAMLGSNQRPLPCEGSALPLS